MMPFSVRPSFRHLAAATLTLLITGGISAQQAKFSTDHRNSEHVLSQSVTGGDAKLRSQMASGRTATSLVVADFDEDGTGDLVSGYAVGAGGALLLQRGNPHALAPTESEFAAASMGQAIVPFASKSEAIKLPVHPDLVKTADIGGHGHSDILVAAMGDTTVYLLRGDGKGNFASPQALSLGGAVSSLAAWKGPEGANFIAAGVCGATGCGVELLDREGAVKSFVPTAGSVTGMEIANLNNGRYLDIAGITANNVIVLDGASLVSGSPQSTSLRVSGAAAVASGSFVYDLRGFGQIAVLGSDATLHVFARAGVDGSTPSRANRRAHKSLAAGRPNAASLAWTEAETVYNVGPGGTSAVMVRGRFSGGGYDDLAVMAGSQYVTVAHPLISEGTQRKTAPVVTTDSTSSTVKAAVATRVSPDARSGIVTAGGFQPNFTPPPSSRTMTVNSTADAVPNTTTMNDCKNGTAGCTLRAAIAVANADSAANGMSHVDTININAGTYTISSNNGAAGGTDINGSFDQHFNVDGSVNFVGAGTATTIINANHLDKVFQLNSGVTTGGAVNPLDIYFSNLTIENGENKNNPNAAGSACANNGFCDYFGGNMDYDSDGPGTLGFTSVTLTGGKIDFGDQGGGGLYVSNAFGQASAPSGLTEFDTSTISSNTAPFQGGGINMGDFTPLTLSSDTISGNSATSSGSSPGEGGGLWSQSDPNDNAASTTAIAITNSTFSSNVASEGGAIWINTSSPTISGSTFSGNTAGAFGGAIYIVGTDRTAAITITTSNFTTNAVTGTFAVGGSPFPTNGAAICTEGGPSADAITLNIHFSRFHGNTGGHATAIGVGCESNSASSHTVTVNATDNWWGCNGAATGTGCDTVLSSFSSGPVITLSPFTNLILTLTSTAPTVGSSFTATGSLGQDSSSAVYSLANDAAYDGVAATLTITQHDNSVTNSSATALSGLAAIATTATATAAGTGTATVTVDGFAVSAGFTVPVSATKLAFTTPPTTPIALGGNPGTVKVSVEDASSNVVTSDSGRTITLTVTGPNSYLAQYTSTDAAGVATFTPASLSNAGSYTYTATATSLTQAVATGVVNMASQTITFTGLPASATFGSAGPYTLNGTASSGLPVTYSVTGPATLSGNTLTITGAGSVAVTASQAGDSNFSAAIPVTQTINVGMASQTITFTGLPANATFGSAGPYTLNGTASSGLPVSYTVTGPATLSGNTLTITGAGSVAVTASQAGNANYSAATPVTQTINVGMASQTITFTGLPASATFGSAGPYTLNGTASSGLPVSYTVTGPATLSGNTLTITGAGSVAVTASQAGNANYSAATPVTQTIVVSPGNQTITFTGLPATATFGSAGPYTLNGTASSGLPVSYTVTGPGSISGTTLTITGAGTVSVTASQAGNANYSAATPVTQTIVVSPGNQTITFTGLPATATFGSAGPYTLNGTASSGLPVSYTVTGPATLSGTTLTITGAGSVAVTASQAGNANFNAATPVTQTIVVSPGNQTITFTGLPASATFGSAGPYALNGTASSGLPVSYTVTGPATLSGTTLTITGPGTVSVTAMQAGNANYNAATPVTQTIVVAASSQTITFTGLPATATFGSAGPYTLNATASSGLPVSYTVTGPATISGTTLTITGAGTVSVTASQAGNANFSAATPVTQTIVVGKANQTITFTGLPANATFGLAGPYTLNGTASSGLPVSYSVSGPASLSGTTLTITGTGVVAVTASQAGDANFNAATPVTQTIIVVANNGTVQLNTTAVLTKLSGGGYMAVITVTNVGTGVAQDVELTGATLGSATGTPLPALLGTIAPSGGSASATVTFPASAGASGALVAERFTGTYTGGTFGGSLRATLP